MPLLTLYFDEPTVSVDGCIPFTIAKKILAKFSVAWQWLNEFLCSIKTE